MESRAIYQLYVDVFENGVEKDIRDFTEEQKSALCDELEELWMEQYRYDWHKCCFVVSINRDEDMLYLTYMENGCHRALPEDCMIREVTVGAPKVNEQTLRLVGDRIPIRLPGFDDTRITVLFSDI